MISLNVETRALRVSQADSTFGIERDNNVKRLEFLIPDAVSDIYSLSEGDIFIHWINEKAQTSGFYKVDQIFVGEDPNAPVEPEEEEPVTEDTENEEESTEEEVVEEDFYKVVDATVEFGMIKFYWVLDRNVLASRGKVSFEICGTPSANSTYPEWHSGIGYGQVLKGMCFEELPEDKPTEPAIKPNCTCKECACDGDEDFITADDVKGAFNRG